MSEIQDFQIDPQDGSKKPKIYDRAPIDRKTIVASVLGVALAGVVGIGAYVFINKKAEHARELKDSEIEGLLRGRQFDEIGLGIDVSGGAKKLFVSCAAPDPTTGEIDRSTGISFFLDDTSTVAQLPLNDADGQYLGDENMQEFPISTAEEIRSFAGGFVAQTCEIITQE